LTLEPRHAQILQRTWDYSKRPLRALVDAAKGQRLARDKIPSAVAMLQSQGLQVDGNLGPIGPTLDVWSDRREKAQLGDYRLLMILDRPLPGYSKDEVQRLLRFVEQGGGLLLCGCFYRGPHGWYSNTSTESLAAALGVRLENDSICDSVHNALDEPRFPRFTAIAPHDVTRGVHALQSKGMASLRLFDERLGPLISSGAGSYRVVGRWDREDKGNLTCAVVLQRGRGRVAVFGDGQWMLPDYLAQADNARLLANLITWLTQEKAQPLSDPEIRKVLEDFRLDAAR
jgi:hypothetical protein